MPQSCVMIGLHSSCWCKIDPGPAFLLLGKSKQASAVGSRRTAEGFGTKNKKDSCVCGRRFLLEKPFSDESHPDCTPCIMHASAKTSAGRKQDVFASSSFLLDNI